MEDNELVGTSWHNYPSIFALGHRAIAELLADDVLVEEKIDGSQFSFGFINGEFRCRSKGAVLNIVAPEKMFKKAVEFIQNLFLTPEWTYRAEYLLKPKHNVLAYDRVPASNLIIFDINTGHETYLSYDEKVTEAHRLGLEVVPILQQGRLTNVEVFRELLEATSILGGQKIEGVVIKNYFRFGLDKKILMGKFVSEKYKEVHSAEWKKENPTGKDVLGLLTGKYKTPARWQKALQHLRDAGSIEDSPRDIGLLMKEVWPDIEKECKEEIKEDLYRWASPHLRRGITRGLPEWYKELLMEKQFNQENEVTNVSSNG